MFEALVSPSLARAQMAHSHLPALGSEPQGFGSQLGAMQPPAKRARTEPGGMDFAAPELEN